MYQLIKLYFRLFFKNNKGLLIILILLFTSFSTLYINLHQTKINRDTTTQIYDQYIDKYSGIPNNSKEKKILKEFKPDAVIGTGGYICVAVGISKSSN